MTEIRDIRSSHQIVRLPLTTGSLPGTRTIARIIARITATPTNPTAIITRAATITITTTRVVTTTHTPTHTATITHTTGTPPDTTIELGIHL